MLAALVERIQVIGVWNSSRQTLQDIIPVLRVRSLENIYVTHLPNTLYHRGLQRVPELQVWVFVLIYNVNCWILYTQVVCDALLS